MKQWDGVVFHSSIEGGKSGCKIHLEGMTLKASTPQNKEFTLDLKKTQIHWGGTSENLLILRPYVPVEEPSFSIRDGSILNALKREVRDGHLVEQIEALQRKPWNKLLLMLSGLAMFIAAVLVFLYLFLTHGVDWGTELVPYSVDKQIGDAAFESSIQQVTGNGKVFPSKVVKEAMDEMVNRMAKALEDNPFEFEVRVIESPITNAFALPGGKIAVLTGLLQKADGPEEVAGVLAHEISHVTRRHGIKTLVQRVGIYILITALLGDASGLVDTLVQNSAALVGLKFSRDMEREADYYGFELLKKAQMDPKGLKTFFQKIQKQESSVPDWISTHPLTQERIDRMDGWLKEMGRIEIKPFRMDWQEIQGQLKHLKKKEK